jgi:hypothetical protein
MGSGSGSGGHHGQPLPQRSHIPVRPRRHGFTLPDRSPHKIRRRLHASSGWGEAPLDLDSQHTTWSPLRPGDEDIEFLGVISRTHMWGNAKMLLLGTIPADYNSCRSHATALTGAEQRMPNFKVGEYACVKTGEKRYVALTIVSASDSGITFNATSYDPPDVA